MKYYAVTDDPNELMHFGIKGMKWGVIRSPEQLGHHKSTKSRSTSKKASSTKAKSPAYIKASDKLRKMMSSGIEKAKADWKTYNSPAQKAIRQQKREVNRTVRDYKKGEKLFEKHVQLARQGRLKYKGISDDEVSRINNRLYLENQARNQSGREKASFIRRLTDSYKEGIIEGVGRGASGYMNERLTGRGRTTAAIKSEKRMAKFHNSLQGRLAANREARAADRKAARDTRRDIAKSDALDAARWLREDAHDDAKYRRDIQREDAKIDREAIRGYKHLAEARGMDIQKRVTAAMARRLTAQINDSDEESARQKKLTNIYDEEVMRKKALREHSALLNAQADAREDARLARVKEGSSEPKTDWEKSERARQLSIERTQRKLEAARQRQERERQAQERQQEQQRIADRQRIIEAVKEREEQAARVEANRRAREAAEAARRYRERQEQESEFAAQYRISGPTHSSGTSGKTRTSANRNRRGRT